MLFTEVRLNHRLVRNAVKGAFMRSKPVIFEPIQKIQIDSPNDVIGGVTREVSTRRGIIEDMPVEDGVTKVIGTIPVAETFGFSNDIRLASKAELFGTWKMPVSYTCHQICMKVTGEIRKERD